MKTTLRHALATASLLIAATAFAPQAFAQDAQLAGRAARSAAR